MSNKPKLEVADGWKIVPDNQCFEVWKEIEYENQDGEMDIRYEKSFHKTVLQALRKIRREENKECETVEELIEKCEKAYTVERDKLRKVMNVRAELDPYREAFEEAEV